MEQHERGGCRQKRDRRNAEASSEKVHPAPAEFLVNNSHRIDRAGKIPWESVEEGVCRKVYVGRSL